MKRSRMEERGRSVARLFDCLDRESRCMSMILRSQFSTERDGYRMAAKGVHGEAKLFGVKTWQWMAFERIGGIREVKVGRLQGKRCR